MLPLIISTLNKAFKYIRFSPILLSYLIKGRNMKLIQEDLDAALKLCRWHRAHKRILSFFNYICFLPEYRVLYLYRLGNMGKVLSILYPNRLLLYITCSHIEGGLFLQHAHSTRINAKKIGTNCQIWHNVTIGIKVSGGEVPTIGNNVSIGTGACVLGNVVIGNNVSVGANAVVITDIPDDCIAVGVPAKAIPKNNSLTK